MTQYLIPLNGEDCATECPRCARVANSYILSHDPDFVGATRVDGAVYHQCECLERGRLIVWRTFPPPFVGGS